MATEFESEIARILKVINQEQVFTANELMSKAMADSDTMKKVLEEATSGSAISRLRDDMFMLRKQIDVTQQEDIMRRLIADHNQTLAIHKGLIDQANQSAASIFDEIEKTVKDNQ